MFYLTEILGLPVYDSSQARVGKVTELAVAPGAQPPRVTTVLFEEVKTKTARALSFDQVAELSTERVLLSVPRDAIQAFQPDEAFLLLRKDLLDQQVIDVHGRKVVRVNDLALDQRPVNHHAELLLREVDIGLRGAVRRLLQGAVPRTFLRKLEARVKPMMIPWEVVDLIESDPRRQLKLNISHKLLTQLHPADLADIVEELTHKERQAIFSALDDVTAAEALSEIEPRLRRSILESMDKARAADIIEEMPPDTAADLLGDLSEEASSELLEDMNQEDAAEIGELMEFPENSAGGLMTTDYVAIPSTADVLAARDLIAAVSDLPENFNTIFLVDNEGKFAGSVPLSKLVVAGPQDKLAGLQSEPLLQLQAEEPEEEVIELFDKYNLLSLPVVDAQQRLLGVVTVDDVITLLRKKC